jgi:hypothetical protein
MSTNEIFLQRLPQPYRWTYDDHPIAQPVLLGKVNPFLWGLLILLATLYATLALTPDEHLKSVSSSVSE